MKIGVLGSGNGGTALAFETSKKGYEVVISDLPDFLGNIKQIKKQGGVYNRGEAKEFAEVQAVEDIGEVFSQAEIVFISAPAYAIKPFAKVCREYITEGHKVILCPGSSGGALEFKKEIGVDLPDEGIIVAETSTLPYACRLIEPGYVAIYLFVKKFIIASLPSSMNKEIYDFVKDIWPVAEEGKNVMQTSLSCGNPVIHPPITLLNTGLIERTGGDFRFYADGVTKGVGNLIKALDQERIALAKALGVDVITEPQMGVAQGYMTDANYWEGYSKSEAFSNIMAPPSLDYRFMTEDVAYGLTFWSSLGEALGVDTPTINSMIRTADAVTGGSYKRFGKRTLEGLGVSIDILKSI